MIKVAQDLDLSQCTLSVCQMVKGPRDFLDCDLAVDTYVVCRAAKRIVSSRSARQARNVPHDAVRALANGLDQAVLGIDVKPRPAHHERIRARCCRHVPPTSRQRA